LKEYFIQENYRSLWESEKKEKAILLQYERNALRLVLRPVDTSVKKKSSANLKMST